MGGGRVRQWSTSSDLLYRVSLLYNEDDPSVFNEVIDALRDLEDHKKRVRYLMRKAGLTEADIVMSGACGGSMARYIADLDKKAIAEGRHPNCPYRPGMKCDAAPDCSDPCIAVTEAEE